MSSLMKSESPVTLDVFHVDIATIEVWDGHIRQYAEDDKDVEHQAKSIEQNGLLYPIKVFRKAENKYVLIDGLKRIEACKRLGWKEISALVTEEKKPLISTWVANMDRDDPTPLEKCEYLERLKGEMEIKKDKELADLILQGKSNVSQILSLRKLPNAIKVKVRNSKHYGIETLRKLIKMEDDEAIEEFNRLESIRLQKETQQEDTRKRDPEQVIRNRVERIQKLPIAFKKRYTSDYQFELTEREKLEELYELLKGILHPSESIAMPDTVAADTLLVSTYTEDEHGVGLASD
jgi:ParB-like partition proteins